MKRINRKKAFWGAAVGAGISGLFNIFGSLAKANAQRIAAQNTYLAQKRLLDKQNTLTEYNQKLQNQIAEEQNQGIYDEIRQKNYKCGGKIKVKRKKAEWGIEDTGSALSSIFTGLSNLGSSAIDNNAQNALFQNTLKLEEMKFNSNNAGRQYMYDDFNERMKEYFNDKKNINENNNKKKSMFPNRQLYLT